MVKVSFHFVFFMIFLGVCIKLICNLWCYDEHHDVLGNRLYSQDEIIAMSSEEYHELCEKEGTYIIGNASLNHDKYDNMTPEQIQRKKSFDFGAKAFFSAYLLLIPFLLWMFLNIAKIAGNFISEKTK